MILLDTDHFSVLTDSRDAKHSKLVARLIDVEEPVLIPVISVEEQLRAWLAQVRRIHDPHKLVSPYDRLVRLLDTLAEWEIARWNRQAADQFAQLRRAGVRIGTQDLRIAALCIANSAMLLSANLRDFEKVSDLRVEDWLYRSGSR